GKAMWQSYDYENAKGISKGKVKPLEYAGKDDGIKFSYAIWSPAKYDPKKSYPLILCIPEKGVKPTDHVTEKWISPELRDNAILCSMSMPGDDVAAWSSPGAEGKPGGGAHVLLAFKMVRDSFAIDFDRVYLAGTGDGVAAALAIASRSPDRLAGVI